MTISGSGFALPDKGLLPPVEIAAQDAATDRTVSIEPLLRVCGQLAIAVIPKVDQEMRQTGTADAGGDVWHASGAGPDEDAAVNAKQRAGRHSGDDRISGNSPDSYRPSDGRRRVFVWSPVEEVPPRQ